MEDSSNTRGKKRLSDSYSDRQIRRFKKQRTLSCSASLAWLESEGYIPLELTVQNKDTGNVERLILNQELCEEVFGQKDVSDEEIDKINIIIFIKDRFHISGQAYHELAKICKGLPRHWKLKQRIAELNRQWNIYPTPMGTAGVQQNLEGQLKLRIQHLQSYSSRCSLSAQKAGEGKAVWGWYLHRKASSCCQLYFYFA